MHYHDAPNMSLLSVRPLGGESFPVCRKRAQCLLQTTRTSSLFLSDLEKKFSGKQWPILKCLRPGVYLQFLKVWFQLKH